MNYTIEKLSNGCTIVYHYRDSSLSHLGIVLNVGSRDEISTHEYGIAHLLEHCIFLGSTRYPKNVIEQISMNICCDLDAMTTKEATLFNMTLLEQYTCEGIDLLLDMIFTPSFPNNLFKQEKKIIKNEIDRHNTTINNIIYDDIMSTLFERHSLAHPILGNCHTIDDITINDVIQFHKQHYIPNNMLFYYSGSGDYNQLKELLIKKKNKNPNLPAKRAIINSSAIAFQQRLSNKEETDVICAVIYGYAPEDSNDRKLVFLLLKEILSSNMGNGVLFKQLRDRQGLIYNIDMNYTTFTDSAFWDIKYKCRSENSSEIYNNILHILSHIKKYITPNDIDYYKKCLLINILRQEENWRKCLIADALSILSTKEYINYSRFSDLINLITIEDVVSEANYAFSKQNINFREYKTERLSR